MRKAGSCGYELAKWMIGAMVLGLPSIAWADGTGAAAAKGAAAAQLSADQTWVLAAAALVFLMQAGFLIFEVGVVRPKNTVVTALKNVADWTVVSLGFFVVGFALMFGKSLFGALGSTFMLGEGIETATAASGGATSLNWAFFTFQLAFCGTAATIVSGAMAERTGFKAYILFAAVMGLLIYPLFGHWAWGSLYLGDGNEGWLEKLGYHDFAGSSVVHQVGGWASLVGVWIVGPRLGRYGSDGKLNRMNANGLPFSAFGVLILWFSWWGFNGGSTLAASPAVGKIIVNTNLAASVATIVGFMHATLLQNREDVEEKVMGCALGGLVAITASCDVVSPLGAMAVGAVAAPLHNYTFDLVIKRWRMDDVVGAVPVHGFCGVWGVLSVAALGQIGPDKSRIVMLGVQALGCVVCFAWTASISFVVFKLLKATVGIRVDPMREINGLTLSREQVEEEPVYTPAAPGAPGADAELELLMNEIRGHVAQGDRLDRF